MLPAVLSRVLIGAGARGAIGAAGSAVSGVRGIASAFSSLADAASNDTEPNQEKRTQTNNVIIGNFGMAGQAARQKIADGANIPSTAKPANTNASEKMPTKALLDTAIKYLISIDKTLKSQLEFEKTSYDQSVKDQREAIVESKPAFSFSDIKDKLSGLNTNASEGNGFAGKALLGLGALGTAAALIAASLDQTELDALKENVDRFKNTFGWLADLGAMVGAGGVIGFLFGGKGFVGRLKGGLVGMVAAHVLDRLGVHGLFGGGYETDENGNLITDPQTGQPVRQSRAMSAGGYAMAGVSGVIAARYGLKSVSALRTRGQAMGQLARATRATSVVGVQSATRKGTTWLASRRGRIFLTILGRKLGRTMMGKLAKHLARIVAGLLLTATGIGAIPGILMTLASVAFIAWDLYDVATSIWDAWNESEEAVTAQPVIPATNATTNGDATKTSGPGVAATPKNPTASETGQPERAVAFFESKGWTKEQAAGIVGNLIVESGLKTNAVGDNGNAYGIAQWNKVGSPERISNFQRVMGKSLYGSNFTEQLEFVNWELNNSERGAGDRLRNATDASEAAAIVDQYYERSSGQHLERRQSNAAAIMSGDYSRVSTGGAQGYNVQGSGSNGRSLSGMVNTSMEAIGNLFGKLGSSIVKPGIARNFTPSTPDVSERISNESTNLHNDITFGIKSEESRRNIESPTMPAISRGNSKASGSISSMDPNYKNLDVLTRYIAHFRLAA